MAMGCFIVKNLHKKKFFLKQKKYVEENFGIVCAEWLLNEMLQKGTYMTQLLGKKPLLADNTFHCKESIRCSCRKNYQAKVWNW